MQVVQAVQRLRVALRVHATFHSSFVSSVVVGFFTTADFLHKRNGLVCVNILIRLDIFTLRVQPLVKSLRDLVLAKWCLASCRAHRGVRRIEPFRVLLRSLLLHHFQIELSAFGSLERIARLVVRR